MDGLHKSSLLCLLSLGTPDWDQDILLQAPESNDLYYTAGEYRTMYHYAPIVALPMGKLADIALWEWFGVYSRSFYSQSQITFNLSDSSKRQRWDGHWKCHRKLYGWLNQDVWYFSIWLGATGVISDAVRTGSKECFLLLTIDKPLRFLVSHRRLQHENLGKMPSALVVNLCRPLWVMGNCWQS